MKSQSSEGLGLVKVLEGQTFLICICNTIGIHIFANFGMNETDDIKATSAL
jgi:hypothetical protein